MSVASRGVPVANIAAPHTGRTRSLAAPAPAARGADASEENEAIVQFAAPIYYLDEDQGYVEIVVMRLGSMSGPVAVRYESIDGSARAGRNYEGVSGRLILGDGEMRGTIRAKSYSDDLWAPTYEFKVALSDPEDCVLGEHMDLCRVKIMDNDSFPSSLLDHEKLCGSQQAIKSLSPWHLYLEYFKLNLSQEGIRWRVLLILTLDQMKNVYMFCAVWVRMYMVDVLFWDHDQHDHGSSSKLDQLLMESHMDTAYAIGIFYIFSMAVLHLWDTCKIQLDLRGRSKEFLQEGLFRKCLNYSETSRLQVNIPDMFVSITEDSGDVAESVECLLDMAQLCGKLTVLTYFILKQNPSAVYIVLFMPCIMLVFGICRHEKMMRTSADTGDKEVEMLGLAKETCEAYRLIADYAQRPRMNELFQDSARETRTAKVIEAAVKTNNGYAPKWLVTAAVSIFIMTHWRDVFLGPESGGCTLGSFLATAHIFQEIGTDFAEFYKLTMRLSGCLEPLQALTYFLNMETDLREKSDVLKQCRRHFEDSRKALFEQQRQGKVSPNNGERGHVLTDDVPIVIRDLGFTYGTIEGDGDGSPDMILGGVNVSVMQGNLVGIVGKHGTGRTTLMKLIGGVVFPHAGCIYTPTHVRVVHVSQEPQLLNMSAWVNLTFGLTNTTVEDQQRVFSILEKMGMPQTLKLVRKEVEQALAAGGGGRKDKKWASSFGFPARLSVALGSEDMSEPRPPMSARSDRSGSLCSPRGSPCHSPRLGEFSPRQPDARCLGVSARGNGLQDGLLTREHSEEFSEDREVDREDDDRDAPDWQDTINYTERAKVHLARALIMNPEVLVLQRPLFHFNQLHASEILCVLKEFVKSRGVNLPDSDFCRRRPRTLFFTPETPKEAGEADVVWLVDHKMPASVRNLSADEISRLSDEFSFLDTQRRRTMN